ncbi:MAG: IMP dehydrogenase [Microthrixaceae bacterium]
MATVPRDPAGTTSSAEADPLARFGQMGLTFDDVCLVPAASDVVPAQVSTSTRLTSDIALGHSAHVGGHGHRHRGSPRHRHRP